MPHGSASMYKSNPFDMNEALSHSRESGLVLWNEDNLPEEGAWTLRKVNIQCVRQREHAALIAQW